MVQRDSIPRMKGRGVEREEKRPKREEKYVLTLNGIETGEEEKADASVIVEGRREPRARKVNTCDENWRAIRR